jgi:hypothetical protein
LGVGPHALNRKTLSAESLAAAIAAMEDQEMGHRASAPGAAILQEGGVTAAGDKVGRSTQLTCINRGLSTSNKPMLSSKNLLKARFQSRRYEEIFAKGGFA